MSTHPAIELARLTASAYRICPSERGWNLWRFFEWTQDPCGWRVIVADLKTRDDAMLHLLTRLGLSDAQLPAPIQTPRPKVTWGAAEWDGGDWP